MYEIIPRLYLSAYHSVNIGFSNVFIVNCTKDLDMLNEDNLRLFIDDNGNQDEKSKMLSALPEIVKVIDNKLQNNTTVIVHCLAGRQRSATVVAAYLMYKYEFSVDDAIAYVKSKKKDAFFPYVNFRWSLEEYEKVIRLKVLI